MLLEMRVLKVSSPLWFLECSNKRHVGAVGALRCTAVLLDLGGPALTEFIFGVGKLAHPIGRAINEYDATPHTPKQ